MIVGRKRGRKFVLVVKEMGLLSMFFCMLS